MEIDIPLGQQLMPVLLCLVPVACGYPRKGSCWKQTTAILVILTPNPQEGTFLSTVHTGFCFGKVSLDWV